MDIDDTFVKSAPALWQKIIDSAGLQLSTNADDPRGYDDQIYAAICHELFGSKLGDLKGLLIANHVTVEKLLTAFFNATAPFSRMLTRILELYQRAAASRNSTNIEIAIQLDAMGGKFQFDLEAFTRQVKLVEEAIITQNMRRWSIADIWDVAKMFPQEDRLKEPQPTSTDEIDVWIASYREKNHNFPILPQFRRTGVSSIDELLNKLEFDLNGFLNKARQLFGNYESIPRTDAVLLPEPADVWWRASDVRSSAHDFWPLLIVRGIKAALEQIGHDPTSALELETFHKVRSFIDGLQLVRVTRAERIEKLLEVLSLPVWKRREAMYAVWVCAAVLLDLDHFRIEYNVQKGCLDFPFRKRKIATLSQPEQPKRRLEFWSELRTPAVGLVGKRKSAIQPDYRFRIIDDGKVPSDALLIECKQYKRSSVSNFSAAIIDYAAACPSAKVFLCNYGPVSVSVINRVRDIDPKLADRIDAQGLIRPEGDGEFRLRKAVREALAPIIRPPDSPGWPVKGEIKIELVWRSLRTDLDLHLKQGSHWTNYKTTEGVLGSKYFEDQRGDRDPMSTESIRFKTTGNLPYSIFVHRYGGPATLQETEAEIIVLGFDLEIHNFFKVPEGAGDWWHVIDIRSGFSSPIEVNRILAKAPSGFGSGT